jgi:hypothetical protein
VIAFWCGAGLIHWASTRSETSAKVIFSVAAACDRPKFPRKFTRFRRSQAPLQDFCRGLLQG